MTLPGFSPSAPATPKKSATVDQGAANEAAAEEIASRNQGSSRRAEFTRKQRGSLLLKSKQQESTLGQHSVGSAALASVKGKLG